MYAFSRHFYPKWFTEHSGHKFFVSMCSLGIEPPTFCAANTMLYHWATWTPDPTILADLEPKINHQTPMTCTFIIWTKAPSTPPSLEEKKALPNCGKKDGNIIHVFKIFISTSAASVLKSMKWLYPYMQNIGVWWWIFGSRSILKVTPEVFSWD